MGAVPQVVRSETLTVDLINKGQGPKMSGGNGSHLHFQALLKEMASAFGSSRSGFFGYHKWLCIASCLSCRGT